MAKKDFLVFFLSLFFLIGNAYLFNYIIKLYGITLEENDLLADNKTIELILVVLIGPFFETLVLQFLLKLRLDHFNFSVYIKILIHASVFAVLHDYTYVYVIMAFFGGLIFNSYYYYSFAKYRYYALFLVFLLHSFYNLYGFLFVEYLNIDPPLPLKMKLDEGNHFALATSLM